MITKVTYRSDDGVKQGDIEVMTNVIHKLSFLSYGYSVFFLTSSLWCSVTSYIRKIMKC